MSDFPITFSDGSVGTLSDWADAPLLLVNVASKCGFTPQYERSTRTCRRRPSGPTR